MGTKLVHNTIGPLAALGLVLWLVVCVPVAVRAQGIAQAKSPLEVLTAYRKLDASGGRLSAEGWYRSSAFFLRPARPPRELIVSVINGEQIETHPRVTGNKAQVWVYYPGVGQIDSSGRFTYVVAPSLANSGASQPATPGIRGPDASLAMKYELVLTEVRWKFGPGGALLEEVKGPAEWRIETVERQPRVTIQAAIGYLEQMRRMPGNDAVRRNAEKSISILESILAANTRQER